MEKRILGIIASGNPFYVAEDRDRIIGYCYFSLWHLRRAYNSTREITVYLDPEQQGNGYGSRLYEYLLQQIDKKEIHVLIACIYLPNEASVKLHEKFGFQQVSYMKEVGRKFDKWLDIGHWQLIL